MTHTVLAQRIDALEVTGVAGANPGADLRHAGDDIRRSSVRVSRIRNGPQAPATSAALALYSRRRYRSPQQVTVSWLRRRGDLQSGGPGFESWPAWHFFTPAELRSRGNPPEIAAGAGIGIAGKREIVSCTRDGSQLSPRIIWRISADALELSITARKIRPATISTSPPARVGRTFDNPMASPTAP